LFPVIRIDTHTAAVFLAGLDVYKVKRAVRFPFLDLSTLEKRRSACEAEVAVNRSYAPELYFGAVPITREGGRLRIGGSGEAIEWAVHMRRFDETRTLDHVAERGELGPELAARLAELILATYREAEVRDGAVATEALKGVVEETLSSLAGSELFPLRKIAGLASAMKTAFGRVRPLLLARGERHKVRRCHGDLHLRNIVLLDGAPTLFDAIEFDEAIATIDILYDFAFLLMDLWERGLCLQASLLLNRYLWGSPDLFGELEGLATLPLFLSLRAAVRAKVEALRYLDVSGSEQVRQEARRYQAAAHAFLAKAPARLIAIGGLSGTGKSTLAAHLAPAIGRPPGAVHLRSDIERKRLFGVSELSRLPEDAYAEAATERVFAALREQAAIALKAGQSVIVDAVHRRPAERDMIAAVADRLGVRFTGLWLDAPLGVLTERVTERRHDASDATAAIVARQAEEPAGPIAWTRLDATPSPDALSAAALAAVGGCQRRDPPTRGCR
jgi:aminoglycoside phosphotransferase family enzyme/predicted kinase